MSSTEFGYIFLIALNVALFLYHAKILIEEKSKGYQAWAFIMCVVNGMVVVANIVYLNRGV